MFTVGTILHPTDLSPMSEKALHLACSLARDHGARVIVLHVAAAPAIATFAEAMLPPDTGRYRAELEEKLRQVTATPAGVHVEERVEFGGPVSVILQVASETRSDLIVMGTHGRTGISRLLMGSVAEQVLRTASCPVVTVKSLAEDAKSSHDTEANESDVPAFLDS